MFTYRDFDGGTLGLAWTGDLKNAGGVCERNGVSEESRNFTYRVSLLLVCLGWVDFDLGVPPSCPAAQPLLPNSHQPRQNWADSGTLKI